ncbi:protein of unknown function [Streptomyces sp. KY75]|nr:protein of unknown function [Streptomyces sp. KY75]
MGNAICIPNETSLKGRDAYAAIRYGFNHLADRRHEGSSLWLRLRIAGWSTSVSFLFKMMQGQIARAHRRAASVQRRRRRLAPTQSRQAGRPLDHRAV